MMRALVLSVMMLAGTAPAHAEDADIRGAWKFRANTGDNCAFGGQAVIMTNPDPTSEVYACELTARHYCPWQFDFIVRQTCTVEVNGSEAKVRSVIVEFMNSEPTDSYVPDDFNLSIKSSQTMTGFLSTRWGNYPAKWTRDKGSVS